MRPLIFAFASLMAASAAHAGERFVEVWNPPEARLGNPRVAHEPVRHSRLAFHTHGNAERPRPAASMSTVVKPTTASKTAGTPWQTFDDIPRQLTPEGNVLRVKGGYSQAEVVR